jgi:dipeptidyl aminopeptidase/acylaminoacyl peptidase
MPRFQVMCAVVVSVLAWTVGLRGEHDRYRPRFTLDQIVQVRTLGHFAIAPDGARVAYALAGHYFGFPTVPRFGHENNLRILSLATGDIQWLTSGAFAKTGPVFSPDGRRVAFESEDDVWIVNVADGRTTRVTTEAARDRKITWAPDGGHVAFVSNRGGGTDLWIASVAGERHGLRRLTHSADLEDDPQWSPDGATLLFVARSREEYYSKGVFSASAEGGPSVRLTPPDAFDHFAPRWSADGRQIAFLSDRTNFVHVWTMRPDGSGAREFDTGPHEATSPHWTVQPIWSRDGRRILTSVNREGSFDLVVLSMDDGSVETIGSGSGQHHEVGWTRDGSAIYSYENAWSPPDLFLKPIGSGPRRLTSSSHVVFQQQHFADVRRVRFPSLDGLEIPGFLVTPTGLRLGERLPAIVNLHPNGYGQFYDHWNPFLHYLAQSGYVMLLVDQRGSAGYGRVFREAQRGAWGTKTFDDVKAAARFIRAQPFVDPHGVGVLGLSFGGYQALLALTKTPDLFKAGVDLAGPTDKRSPFVDHYNALQIGATEAEDPALYDRISPMKSIGDLRAPLLVLHGDADRNVVIEFTHRLIDELERQHKTYEAKIYPGEAHGLADPAHQLDAYRRIVAFFDRYLKAPGPPPAGKHP